MLRRLDDNDRFLPFSPVLCRPPTHAQGGPGSALDSPNSLAAWALRNIGYDDPLAGELTGGPSCALTRAVQARLELGATGKAS